MSTGRLFDVAPSRQRHEWGRWLPVPAPARCPRRSCGRLLVEVPSATQPALFVHGGYGAAVRSTVEMCVGCGWVRTVATETVNPRRV